MNYYISDLHLFHRNVTRAGKDFDDRPFDNIEEMHSIMKYLARNTRLSICFEDGYYHDYLMISDIPAEKYKDLYVYGVGMVI